MRPLILGQTYFLSKLEYDSTTHIDKRTTFWCSTFDMKNKKISKSCDHIISVIYRWNRLNEPKKHELHRKWNLKNVQFRKTNFYFTIVLEKLLESYESLHVKRGIRAMFSLESYLLIFFKLLINQGARGGLDESIHAYESPRLLRNDFYFT